MKPPVLTLTLLLPLVLGLTLQEDDIVFDDIGEEMTSISPVVHRKEHETPRIHAEKKSSNRVERLWGVADTSVTVGHLFKLKIPEEAFGGSVDHYEVHSKNKKALPHWLYWEDDTLSFLGFPSKKDVGQYHVTVTAYGKQGDVAKDSFTIRVEPERFDGFEHKDGKTHCKEGEERKLLTITLDSKFDDLKPMTKVKAIKNLAGFYGLDANSISMHSQSSKNGAQDTGTKSRKEKHSTSIQWQVGCEGHIWTHQAAILERIRSDARDGTLVEVLQIPVYSTVAHWQVKTDDSRLLRDRREIGSGDNGNNDDEEYDYDEDYDESYDDAEREDDEENDAITEMPPRAYVPNASASKDTETEQEHPHRHHHGEEAIGWKPIEEIDEHDIVPMVNQQLGSGFNGSSTTPVTRPSTENTEVPTSSVTAVPSTAIVNATTTTEEMPTTVVITSTPTTPEPLPETTPEMATGTTEASTTTTTTATTPTTTTTTTEMPTTTTTTTTTEKIEYGVRNFPPRQDRRLKKIPVTAGKPLSYFIPADTFSDIEDGDTRNLRLSLYLQGNPVKSTHWLQLNPETQEVYGLPLENDVSKWDHDLVASDSEGLNVTERLDIYVQQHKLSRSVNHEFSIYLRIDKRTAFPNNVDWELKVVRSLAQLYGDNDPSQITVRSIDVTQDQAIFTWTNDSVPRSSECPKDEINRLLNVLIADKDGEPSGLLLNAMGPEIRVKRVVYQGLGQCEEMKRPEAPKIPTQEPKNNFAPIPRNQVDHINATVGKLLVYKVPDDTFYDPEDGSAYNMQMSLLTNDRTPIPASNWLQFDVKNREFFGVPLREDIGRKEYQLVVTDKEGASATDGMVVIVQPAPFMGHSVEFSMTLAIPYESFVNSALQKRTFIEKVAELFDDKDTNAISLDSITEGSTIVTWRNTSLPTHICPNAEITRLSEILVKSDKSLTDRIEQYLGEEFPVKQITLTPLGMCQGQLTGVYSPENHTPPSEDSRSVGTTSDDYLITCVLPAIIIAAMLLLAGIIACVLYRRRRSGKMSVSEQDDERQSFRSKGIPVIFQDELEEKPDPGNKSPVILKEEKPPLPPPEYQKAEDGADVPMLSQENSEEPYQPPPPFATNRDNNRQNRPKPTPTYRKPPPYVPP